MYVYYYYYYYLTRFTRCLRHVDRSENVFIIFVLPLFSETNNYKFIKITGPEVVVYNSRDHRSNRRASFYV